MTTERSGIAALPEQWQQRWAEFGFAEEMPIQQRLIPAMSAGRHALAQSPTGSGKTLAYALPLLAAVDAKSPALQALVLAPSQELAMQIMDVLKQAAAGSGIGIVQLIGGANMQRQIEKLKAKPAIAVGTPGRIRELLAVKKLKLQDAKTVVLDEADQLLAAEHREAISGILRAANDPQIVALTATVTEELKGAFGALADVDRADFIRVEASELPASGAVVHSFVKTEERDKTDQLRRLAHVEGMRALAFVGSLDQLLMKDAKLAFRDASIAALHGSMKKEERKRALDAFRSGAVRILLATDVAARGLDIEGITHVIHVDVPRTPEQYVHRSGRTGRAGAGGEVLTLLSYADEKTYRKLARDLQLKPIQKTWFRGALEEGSSRTVAERPKRNGGSPPKRKPKKG